MKRLLITGASGLLGTKLAEISSKSYETIGTYNKNYVRSNCKMIKLDIKNKNQVFDVIGKMNPNFVIHTAAFTNVDQCETKKHTAWDINVKGTENIVKICEKIGAKLIYMSTDFVFDGKKEGKYKETDTPNPINWYGKTKLEGEKLIQKSRIDFIITRTSVLYGWNLQKRLNFVTWAIEKLKNNEKIKIVTNQWNSPTLANNLAYSLINILNKKEHGMFHMAGSERINRFDFAKKIAKIFNLNENLIEPIKSEKLKQIAKRPTDSSLNIEKAKKIGIKFLNIEKGLNEMKRLKY
ncbi:MAG: dTDP-4-dehydrorhamnose reductase [Candidatus Aenigmatarchaeota archaeon]|nr:MAG: dTDP-4-dehydrorhamnose reductase [Candidatus Aenigmarchaeota archaeon]